MTRTLICAIALIALVPISASAGTGPGVTEELYGAYNAADEKSQPNQLGSTNTQKSTTAPATGAFKSVDGLEAKVD